MRYLHDIVNETQLMYAKCHIILIYKPELQSFSWPVKSYCKVITITFTCKHAKSKNAFDILIDHSMIY